jgi:hypothetical protein
LIRNSREPTNKALTATPTGKTVTTNDLYRQQQPVQQEQQIIMAEMKQMMAEMKQTIEQQMSRS